MHKVLMEAGYVIVKRGDFEVSLKGLRDLRLRFSDAAIDGQWIRPLIDRLIAGLESGEFSGRILTVNRAGSLRPDPSAIPRRRGVDRQDDAPMPGDGDPTRVENVRRQEVGESELASAPHSSHYKGGEIEPIHLIESQKLPFHLANVVKYAVRSWFLFNKPFTQEGRKEIVHNLDKAEWYLKRFRSNNGV